jgi:hypothetical protein
MPSSRRNLLAYCCMPGAGSLEKLAADVTVDPGAAIMKSINSTIQASWLVSY